MLTNQCAALSGPRQATSRLPGVLRTKTRKFTDKQTHFDPLKQAGTSHKLPVEQFLAPQSAASRPFWGWSQLAKCMHFQNVCTNSVAGCQTIGDPCGGRLEADCTLALFVSWHARTRGASSAALFETFDSASSMHQTPQTCQTHGCMFLTITG